MLEEILTIDADVICLQEVDHFPFLKSVLKAIGYEGTFFPKPDSPCLYSEETNGPDGCSMFYKKDVFNVINTDTVVLKTSDKTPQYTNQVCIILKLEIKDESATKKTVAIATTHLKAKTGYHQLRHSQGCYLLNYLKENYASIPLIVCGDFNADPKEPVIEAFVSSPLNLDSAYKRLSPSNEEAPFTTWKIRGGPNGPVEVSKTIDYMWYTPSTVSVRSLRSIPSGDELGVDRLPSFSYPSDHLSLAADFDVSSA